MNYKPLHSQESSGSYGSLGIKIEVASSLSSLDRDGIRLAAYEATKLIEVAIMSEVLANDPKAKERTEKERSDLLGLFEHRTIFVETIPNGYCSDWCCKHLPWFVVTTSVGRIKIGWRKRVIEIDWSQTVGTKTSDELFASENVTKSTRLIHAWSLEDARRYIDAILTAKPFHPVNS